MYASLPLTGLPCFLRRTAEASVRCRLFLRKEKEKKAYKEEKEKRCRSSPRIFQRNSLYRDGTVVLNTGRIPTLDWNRYANVSLVADMANQDPVILTTSEFHDSSIVGESPSAPIILDNCYLENTAKVGNVQENNAAPSPWIGLTTVPDPRPKLGGVLRLETELPLGIGAVWHIGLAQRRPVVTGFPYVFYIRLNTLIPLPPILDQHKTLELQIPTLRSLVGLEFHAQAVTVPLLGQTHVPPLHLPIGSLIRVNY